MAEIVKCICNPQEAFPQTTEKVDTLLPLGLREAAHHAMLRGNAYEPASYMLTEPHTKSPAGSSGAIYRCDFKGSVVAGVGFEPTTFRL